MSRLNPLNQLFIILILVVLSGCAATTKAPIGESEQAKSFKKSLEKGVVYLYRPGKIFASGAQYMIRIDDKEAGGTGPGTFFRWELPPGKYTIASSTPESSAILKLDVKANEHYFIKQGVRMGALASRVHLNYVDEPTGIEAVKGCKLLVSSY